MKTLLKTSLLAFTLAMALAACGGTTINIPLDSFSISIDATANTVGKVVYPKDAATFEKPVVNVKTITLTGNVKSEYTAIQAPLEMKFYARVTDPSAAGCQDGGLVWICDASGETAISGSYTFQNGDTQPIELGATNPQVLADGINAGKIWIGAEVTSGAATNVKFSFSNMVAHVTIF